MKVVSGLVYWTNTLSWVSYSAIVCPTSLAHLDRNKPPCPNPPEQVVAIYTGPGYNPVSRFTFLIFWHCVFIEASDKLEAIEITIMFPLSQISVAVTHIVVFCSSLINVFFHVIMT